MAELNQHKNFKQVDRTDAVRKLIKKTFRFIKQRTFSLIEIEISQV